MNVSDKMPVYGLTTRIGKISLIVNILIVICVILLIFIKSRRKKP